MSTEIGDRVPNVTVQVWKGGELTTLCTESMFAKRRVLLVCMPGAYTPTCSKEHLPGYVRLADKLRAQGVDAIICMAANDPYVMHAWAREHDATGKVEVLPDGNGDFTRAMGLELDLSELGMGKRCQRAALLIDDGRIVIKRVEPNPDIVTNTAAASCLPEV